MSKHIQNVHIALINCKILKTIEEGALPGRKEYLEFPFQPEYIDHGQNRQIHSGFRTLSDEEFVRLSKESKLFTQMIERGKLIVRDELPESEQTQYQIITGLKERLFALEQENEGLKSGKGVASKKELDDARADLAQTQAKLADALSDLEAAREQAGGTGADLGDATEIVEAKDAKIGELLGLLHQVKKIVDEKNFKPAAVLLKDLPAADSPQF